MIDSRKPFDWKDHDINQAYLKFLGKYGFVFTDFKGKIRRFPNKSDNMNGNATDLSGTSFPEAKTNVAGTGSQEPGFLSLWREAWSRVFHRQKSQVGDIPVHKLSP